MCYKIINATKIWFSFMWKYFNWHQKVHWTIRNIMQDEGATYSGRQNRKQPGLRMGVFLSYPNPPYSRLQSTAVLLSPICFDVCPVSCIMNPCDCKAWPLWAPITPLCCDVQFPVNTVFDSILADTHLKSPVPVKPRVDIFGLFVILMQLISMHKTLSWLFAFPGTK